MDGRLHYSTKRTQEKLATAAARAPFDAIIIPGIPYDGDSWDSVMKSRVLWSYILYRRGFAKNIIYSGGAVYSPYKEGIVMSLYGKALGIPAEHIFVDTQAKHSTENVYYSYLLARKLGFKSIALATDPFQSFMLRRFVRKRFGTPVTLVPFISDSLRAYNHLNPKIDAASAKVSRWTGIKEEQKLGQRIRGTMGKSINWSQYPNGRVDPL